MEEFKVVEIIEKMVDFMEHTNEILAKLTMRMDNIEVDIQKLRKKNINRIITPDGIIQGDNGSDRLG